MAALFYRVCGRWCSSRCLGAGINVETRTRSPGRLLRAPAGLLSSSGRPRTLHGGAEHTEAAGPLEVDLRRLEGEDDGRRTGQKQICSKHATCHQEKTNIVK